MRAISAYSLFELGVFFRTLRAFFFLYIMPCALYGIAVSQQSNRASAAGTLLPYFVGLMMVFAAMYTLATQVVLYRESGFYKRLLVTNLNGIGIAISAAVRGYVLLLIGWLILLVETWVGFRVFPSFSMVEAFFAVVVAGAALFSFAMIPACFVKRGQSMFAYATVLTYVLAFFSGARPSMGAMERYAHAVDLVSPGYYALNVLRAGFSGHLLQAAAFYDMGALLVITALSLLVVRFKFSWM